MGGDVDVGMKVGGLTDWRIGGLPGCAKATRD
jgi:hypothetical protein